MVAFANTLRNYSVEKLRADTRAAANVMMLALPQSIAYAAIAGLPIVHGIVCSAVAAMVAPANWPRPHHMVLGLRNGYLTLGTASCG